MMAGTKLGEERRKEVDEQMARCGAAAATAPLGSDSPTITRYYFVVYYARGGLAGGGVLQVYYYGKRSGQYLYCLCADHWLNRITNPGKH